MPRTAGWIGVGLLALAACAPRGGADDAPPAPADPWFQAGRAAVAEARARVGDAGRARNVIVFIGDGMGLSTVTAARILEGQRRGEPGEENLLSFEELPFVALAKTDTTDFQVPDSAGTMTAMMAGVKTRSGVLGVTSDVARGDHAAVAAHRVATLFEHAEHRGLATGIVTTTSVTHATPAGAYAHCPDRKWQFDARLPPDARAAGFPDLARQLVEFPHGDGIDVVLGGGRSHFFPVATPDPEHAGLAGVRTDGRDLVAEWRAARAGAEYVWNRAQLEALDPAAPGPLLGLFEWEDMQFEADRERDRAGEPSLTEMTTSAIDRLSRNPRGFVLMVEAGRIDHAHHLGNAYRALLDTIELSDAVRAARERTRADETLIVVTADHGHVLTMGGYPKRGNAILGRVESPGTHPRDPVPLDALGLPYTTLAYANGPGYTGPSNVQPEGVKRFPHLPNAQGPIAHGRPDLGEVDTTAPDFLQEAAVPLPRETHSGEDVPIYAGGPGAALFQGVQEQNYVYHALVAALGWD